MSFTEIRCCESCARWDRRGESYGTCGDGYHYCEHITHQFYGTEMVIDSPDIHDIYTGPRWVCPCWKSMDDTEGKEGQQLIIDRALVELERPSYCIGDEVLVRRDVMRPLLDLARTLIAENEALRSDTVVPMRPKRRARRPVTVRETRRATPRPIAPGEAADGQD